MLLFCLLWTIVKRLSRTFTADKVRCHWSLMSWMTSCLARVFLKRLSVTTTIYPAFTGWGADAQKLGDHVLGSGRTSYHRNAVTYRFAEPINISCPNLSGDLKRMSASETIALLCPIRQGNLAPIGQDCFIGQSKHLASICHERTRMPIKTPRFVCLLGLKACAVEAPSYGQRSAMPKVMRRTETCLLILHQRRDTLYW